MDQAGRRSAGGRRQARLGRRVDHAVKLSEAYTGGVAPGVERPTPGVVARLPKQLGLNPQAVLKRFSMSGLPFAASGNNVPYAIKEDPHLTDTRRQRSARRIGQWRARCLAGGT